MVLENTGKDDEVVKTSLLSKFPYWVSESWATAPHSEKLCGQCVSSSSSQREGAGVVIFQL